MPINVNIDEVAEALQIASYDSRYFLNLDTGNVVCYSDGILYDDDAEEPEEDETGGDVIDRGNYAEIDALPSREAFELMERYIETLPEGIERIRLTDAIGGGKPFRRFKDILVNYPELRVQWFEFEKAAY